MIVRRGSIGDSRAIALVHVSTWQSAYRGIVPQAHLDQLSVTDRERMWVDTFQRNSSETLVADMDGNIIGFISFGNSRSEPAVRDVGETYAFYVAPAHWSTGVGRALWGAALARLRELSVARVIVWVLAANEQAIRFYELVGFSLSARSETFVEIGAEKLPELRYELAII